MTDWRQIQARIRKAKASTDAVGKLSLLFQRTRDGMVAFELAQIVESSGRADEAARWYMTAFERFRRAEWKKKAEEALVRLGAPLPAPAEPAVPAEPRPKPQEVPQAIAVEPSPRPEADVVEPVPSVGRGQRKRRGRRGGRRHRQREREKVMPPGAAPAEPGPEPEGVARPEFPPRLSETELSAARVSWPAASRAGEPALASRMAQLESQLRRLIASPLHRLDEAEQAPAGPGVYLLSDSDQVTHYFVEACETLRIGLGHLLRSGRGGRREASVPLKARLAEHLGITESRVAKYMKEHCAVRWIQLDEGASHLAHFAVAVLRPVVNE